MLVCLLIKSDSGREWSLTQAGFNMNILTALFKVQSVQSEEPERARRSANLRLPTRVTVSWPAA